MKTTDTPSASTLFPSVSYRFESTAKTRPNVENRLVRFLDVTRSFGANRREAPAPIDEKAQPAATGLYARRLKR
jgi:hypothetical protein